MYCSYWIAERRQAEAARIREKYPDRIPVLTKQIWFMSAAWFMMFPLFNLTNFDGVYMFYNVGHCGKGWKKWHTWYRQEKVSKPWFIYYLVLVWSVLCNKLRWGLFEIFSLLCRPRPLLVSFILWRQSLVYFAALVSIGYDTWLGIHSRKFINSKTHSLYFCYTW